MPMKMGWRWYGEGNDPVTLSDIKQIPGVTSIVWALHNKMPGEIWEIDEIQKVADQIHAYGFDMDVVESVNVHDDIKIGLPTRDKYIENYKQCIRNLSKFGVKVICYNFMPVFDWTRTDLFHPVGDGSTALFYEKDKIKGDYKAMAEYIMSFTEKYNMTFPGWEPERMAKLDELFKAYAPVTKEKLWENLKYFLEALMPTCHECGIKMAIHQDDPPWDIFGLPRLLVDAESIDRFLSMVDDPYNCLTLCTGSLNANPNNNCAEIVRKHCDRIAFGHIRNIHHFPNGDFSEAAHRDCCGETGIIEVLRAYHDCGFEGYIRPDHGRQLCAAYKEGNISVRTDSKDFDSWYNKRTAADGKIDFHGRTREIYNLIRGVAAPFPGAFAYVGEEKVTVWEAQPFDEMIDFSAYAPGEVIDVFDGHPIVRTVDGSLLIKKYESAKELQAGDVLA